MAEPFIGEIRMFGFNFPPQGWATCDGQLMSIAQNTALFSLLGTTYGGNGQTTFALPDLRGRMANHQGQGPGLSPYVMGQVSGTETVTILSSQLPPHTHPAYPCSTDDPTSGNPKNNFPAAVGTSIYSTTSNASMGSGSTGPAGGGQPLPNLPPYLTINFCIALVGIFPSRN
jgi:microcystin-dependent protein